MNIKHHGIQALAVAAALGAPNAFATNGYFQHGYGVKAQGMGGAGAAFSQDALAAATNPAGMAWIGNRMDFGMMYFRPDRETELVGDASDSAVRKYNANEDAFFLVPDFGLNRMINNDMSVGVSVYGNGGMNTSYDRNIPMFSGTLTDKAGIDLSQLFIAPNMAWKLSKEHSVGASVILAYQRIKINGLANFDSAAQTSAVGSVTNRGYDDSTGIGFRLGWMGQITPTVTVGASYQPEINMSKFNDYKGLFAEQGNFDIPSTYTAGIAFKATPQLTVAFDIAEINYTDSKAVSNPLGPVSGMGVLSNTLGTDGGAGFGWRDITVYKLGFSYQHSPTTTLRFGWNHNDQPIPTDQTFFNILAPGVVTDHLTLGATWKLAKDSEVSFMYTRAFSEKVSGSGSIPTAFQGYANESNLEMHQNSFSLGFGWTF